MGDGDELLEVFQEVVAGVDDDKSVLALAHSLGEGLGQGSQVDLLHVLFVLVHHTAHTLATLQNKGQIIINKSETSQFGAIPQAQKAQSL